MKQIRKVYNQAFKEKAVQLSYERANIVELARELEITPQQLHKWRKELEVLREESLPKKENLKQTPMTSKKSKNTTLLEFIMSNSVIILFSILVVSVIVMANQPSSYSYDNSNNNRNTQSESSNSYHVTQVTYAATSEEIFHDMFKYFRVNDQEVINRLLYNEDLIILPEGTELYLLGGNGITYAIVREKGSTQKLWVVPQHISK